MTVFPILYPSTIKTYNKMEINDVRIVFLALCITGIKTQKNKGRSIKIGFVRKSITEMKNDILLREREYFLTVFSMRYPNKVKRRVANASGMILCSKYSMLVSVATKKTEIYMDQTEL